MVLVISMMRVEVHGGSKGARDAGSFVAMVSILMMKRARSILGSENRDVGNRKVLFGREVGVVVRTRGVEKSRAQA